MSRVIVKLDGRYMDWSTISDAPMTCLMDREQFAAYYREEYGRSGMRDLEARLTRADARGVSMVAPEYESAEDFLIANRAGENEEELTVSEIIERFGEGRP